MKLLVDMNLSPDWAPVLAGAGWEAVHWSTVGDTRADDRVLFEWARTHGYVVFTHDLDLAPCWPTRERRGPASFRCEPKTSSPTSSVVT